jgi:hypothetical protein
MVCSRANFTFTFYLSRVNVNIVTEVSFAWDGMTIPPWLCDSELSYLCLFKVIYDDYVSVGYAGAKEMGPMYRPPPPPHPSRGSTCPSSFHHTSFLFSSVVQILKSYQVLSYSWNSLHFREAQGLFITAVTCSTPVPILSHIYPVRAPASNFLNISILILSSHLCLCLP